MSKRAPYYIIFIIIICIGCNRGRIKPQLVLADSLLNQEQNDSAYALLNLIHVDSLNAEERAYYNLLLAQANWVLYINNTPDSLLDYTIYYYLKHPDNRKLAYAYYYKGVRFERLDSAIIYLKKAEQCAELLDDPILKSKIFSNITAANIDSEEFQLALKYAFKELQLNLKLKKYHWIASSYKYLAQIYYRLGKKDSAVYYSWQYMPLLKYVQDEKVKSSMLNNLCSFDENLNRDSVLTYIENSYRMDSSAVMCGNLAAIYAEHGKYKEAERLWRKALSTKDLSAKVKVMRTYIRQKKSEGKEKLAADMSVQLIKVQDSLNYQLRNQQVGKIQTEFDQQTKLNEEKGYRKSLYGWIAFCVVLLIISTIYIRYRICKSRIAHQADQMQIKESKETIAALEAEGAQHQELLAEQQKVLLQHQENHSQSLDRGRLLYEQIRSGQNTSLWDKHDFQDFLNYYWSVDAAFISRLKSDYKNLTPRQQFFLILEHEGFGDEEIMRIFGICNSAIRSKRCRIRQQKKQAK